MINKMVRLPEEVSAWVKSEADEHQRSQNSQIIWILRQAMAADAAPTNEPTSAPVFQTEAPADRIQPES